MSRLFFLLLSMLLPAVAIAAPDVARLREQSAQAEMALERDRPALYYDLLAGSEPGARILNESSDLRLQYIRPDGTPVYYALLSLISAQSIGTDLVWPGGITGYNLDGSGTSATEMAMWDGGDARWTHETLVGRVFDGDGPGDDHPHVTWVAGVLIAAEGFDPRVKGMSFASSLAIYSAGNDNSEMALAAASGLRVSNHSYEIPGGWRYIEGNWYWFGDLDVDPIEDFGFGFYGDKARTWDQIAYDAPEYFIQKGCGNDRGDGPAPGATHFHWDNQLEQYVSATDTHDLDGDENGYDCVSWFGNAKNIVSVGAVEDIPGGYTQPSDVVPTYFTSYGPCDDGRIKPDIVANGSGLWMPDWASDSSYAQKSGTSLSGPCVAGSVNLLREFYETSIGTTPKAATLKALILQTADEAGLADGPDYRFGWGLMNTRVAADLVATGEARFREEDLFTGEEDLYTIYLPTDRDLRVTMVWTDPPGTPAPPSVDPPDRMLVNDLDLRVFPADSSTIHIPWILDGTDPAAPATRGDNVIDNLERVDIASAAAGVYVVSVSAKDTLDGPQTYSLVASEAMYDGGPVSLSGPVSGSTLALSVYPNPVVASTAVSFVLPYSDRVTLHVLDVTGRVVSTVLSGKLEAGPHRVSWNSRDRNGKPLPSGVYFLRLSSETASITSEVVVIR